MINDFRHITIAAVIALMLLLAGVLIGHFATKSSQNRAKIEPNGYNLSPVPDTTWFTITDTVTVPSPPDTIMKILYKVVTVPLEAVEHDTAVDSARVTLPFERHHAAIEDVAEVWYSGFQAQIDSAVAYRHHTTEIVDHYITILPPANLVTASAGAKDASLTYMHRLGSRFWLGASAGTTYDGIPSARVSVGIQF